MQLFQGGGVQGRREEIFLFFGFIRDKKNRQKSQNDYNYWELIIFKNE